MGSRIRSPLPESDHQLLSRDLQSEPDSSCNYRQRPKLSRPHGALKRHVRLKRSPLKSASKGLKAEQLKYRKLSAAFLALPENKWCLCCIVRREGLGENIIRNQSSEVHHWAGRIGRLLCYVPFFRAFCNACRTWPHVHPSKAREQLNLLVVS